MESFYGGGFRMNLNKPKYNTIFNFIKVFIHCLIKIIQCKPHQIESYSLTVDDEPYLKTFYCTCGYNKLTDEKIEKMFKQR